MWPVGDYTGRITPTASEAFPAANTSYYTLWQTWASEAIVGEGEQRDIAVESCVLVFPIRKVFLI